MMDDFKELYEALALITKYCKSSWLTLDFAHGGITLRHRGIAVAGGPNNIARELYRMEHGRPKANELHRQLMEEKYGLAMKEKADD